MCRAASLATALLTPRRRSDLDLPEQRGPGGNVREKLSSLDPSPWRECTGDLPLNLREVEVLEIKDEEEEESEVDEKVKEVRENAQLMHATW